MQSNKIRRHTIVATRKSGELCAMLEKDWFSYEWVSGWPVRHVIERPQGQFHVCASNSNVSRSDANHLVDQVLRGYILILALT